jgi:predicted P-loop ATPase
MSPDQIAIVAAEIFGPPTGTMRAWLRHNGARVHRETGECILENGSGSVGVPLEVVHDVYTDIGSYNRDQYLAELGIPIEDEEEDQEWRDPPDDPRAPFKLDPAFADLDPDEDLGKGLKDWLEEQEQWWRQTREARRLTAQELLEQNGIHLKNYNPGKHSRTCPKCLPDRKRENKKKRCLSIKIDDRGATWNCHNCGWSGPEKGSNKNNERKEPEKEQHTNDRKENDQSTNNHEESNQRTNDRFNPHDNNNFVATYDYPGFQKVRFPKGHEPPFLIRHRVGNHWEWGAGGADTSVLYRKEEVDEAIANGHEIVCVEGEKDANNLWAIGIPATCSAHGAAKPDQKPKWTIEQSKQLAGAAIVVLGDHDAPGYAHQEATCECSLGIAKRVRILKLADHWPEIKEGEDVSDWLAAGHTREELDALLAQAPEYAPETTTSTVDDDKLEDVIRNGAANNFDGDQSRAAAFVITAMIRQGYCDQRIVSVLTDRRNRISDYVFDKSEGDPEAFVRSELERAKSGLEFDTNEGAILKTTGNVRIAMVKLGVEVRYDRFGDRILVNGIKEFGPVLDDAAVDRLWITIKEKLYFNPSQELLLTVLRDTARRNGFHPVCDYLSGLKWDGVARIDEWLTTYGGAENTPYTRAVAALFLIAAVRRVRHPGCKFDEMLVLEAEQGKDRSTALAILAVQEDWFSDDLPLNADTQKVIERTRGRWIIEAAELSGMRRGEVEHIKAFLSRRHDRARLVWDKLTANVPRQFVVAGTTNAGRYLKDITGNRRFWPVATPQFDLAALRRDRDQLWAEAAMREARGDSIRLDPSLWSEAAKAQEARQLHDPYHDALYDALHEFKEGKIAGNSIWIILNVRVGDQTQDDNMRVGQAMKDLGWQRTKVRIDGKVVNGYTKTPPNYHPQQSLTQINAHRDSTSLTINTGISANDDYYNRYE